MEAQENSRLAEELRRILAEQGNGERAEDVDALLDWVRLTIPALEGAVRSMDKPMDSANAIFQAAEKSGYDITAVSNALRSHERQMGASYAQFVEVKERIQALAKDLKLPMVKPKSPGGGRSAPKDVEAMDVDEIVLDTQRLLKGLVPVVNKAAEAGAFVLKELRKVAAYKAPKAETVRNDIAALIPSILDYRDAMGLVYGMVGGVVKRMNVRAAKKGEGGIVRPGKGRKESYENPVRMGDTELLEWAKRRDYRRGMALFEQDNGDEEKEKEKEMEKKEQETESYGFKVVRPGTLPVYATSLDEAKRLQAEHDGSKIEVNESGRIDDPMVLEASGEDLVKDLPWAKDPD